ncbi:hypothetical protein [Dyadobacter frigoris]|uniref:Uncharacterized protein n=1 Tax=Dyadobacter frigoris TaxID=2576211 RepID=A0A4U6D6S4_9BACT|nr:hypothetical protein [Dyadobacter frigoris]TKT93090.1 hypothetical protein FDK13_04340 [Dyadobacter frigoris]GLU55966.1 hypothetical protein Dfri01_54270 [Dyadobacter frigoris]
MKNCKLVVIFLLACVLTSCRTTAILTETFESDIIGSLPVKDIPGDPAGDQITYEAVLNPRLRITTSATNTGEKALTFSQAPATGLDSRNQFVGFRGSPTSFTQPLWFYYTGTVTGYGSDLMMDITDGTSVIIVRMIITNSGDVTLMRSLPGEMEWVGNIPPGTSHTTIISLNMNTKKYNLTIIKSGGNIIAKDRPIVFGDLLYYANPAHPSIDFQFNESTFEMRKFIIESVNISRKEP